MSELFLIDTRARQVERRSVRDGNAMLTQCRCNLVNHDGSVEYGEWKTIGTIPNYGDCFDKKPSFWQRILGK